MAKQETAQEKVVYTPRHVKERHARRFIATMMSLMTATLGLMLYSNAKSMEKTALADKAKVLGFVDSMGLDFDDASSVSVSRGACPADQGYLGMELSDVYLREDDHFKSKQKFNIVACLSKENDLSNYLIVDQICPTDDEREVVGDCFNPLENIARKPADITRIADRGYISRR